MTDEKGNFVCPDSSQETRLDSRPIPFWDRRCGGYYLGSPNDMLIVPALRGRKQLTQDSPVRDRERNRTMSALMQRLSREPNLTVSVVFYSQYEDFWICARHPGSTKEDNAAREQQEERLRKWCQYGESCAKGVKCSFYYTQAEKALFAHQTRWRRHREKVKLCKKSNLAITQNGVSMLTPRRSWFADIARVVFGRGSTFHLAAVIGLSGKGRLMVLCHSRPMVGVIMAQGPLIYWVTFCLKTFFLSVIPFPWLLLHMLIYHIPYASFKFQI